MANMKQNRILKAQSAYHNLSKFMTPPTPETRFEEKAIPSVLFVYHHSKQQVSVIARSSVIVGKIKRLLIRYINTIMYVYVQIFLYASGY